MNKSLPSPKIIVDVNFLETEFSEYETLYYKSIQQKLELIYRPDLQNKEAIKLTCTELFGRYNPSIAREFLDTPSLFTTKQGVHEFFDSEQELRVARQNLISLEFRNIRRKLRSHCYGLKSSIENRIRLIPAFRDLDFFPKAWIDERSVVFEAIYVS